MLEHYLPAVVLGAVQGLTEFIPISSSGHLIIARELLHIPDQGNFFDAILHLAPLLPLVIYFRSDWANMISAWFSSRRALRQARTNRRLLVLIVVATLPALVVAPLANGWVEDHFRSIVTVAIFMVVVGITFILMERWGNSTDDLNQLSAPRALGIGLAQALAILPGISRSGATIVAGMYMNLRREVSAKFSFLMATPIIAVAGLYSLYESVTQGSLMQDWQFWAAAFVVSVLSGLVAIKFLLAFLRRYSLDLFAYYLILAGLVLLVVHFFV